MSGLRIFLVVLVATFVVAHSGAIDIATQAKANARHIEIRELAARITAAQRTEVAQMERWRIAWYGCVTRRGPVRAPRRHRHFRTLTAWDAPRRRHERPAASRAPSPKSGASVKCSVGDDANTKPRAGAAVGLTWLSSSNGRLPRSAEPGPVRM